MFPCQTAVVPLDHGKQKPSYGQNLSHEDGSSATGNTWSLVVEGLKRIFSRSSKTGQDQVRFFSSLKIPLGKKCHIKLLQHKGTYIQWVG